MPASPCGPASTKLSLSLYSLSESTCNDNQETDTAVPLTPLQKLTTDMCKDEKTIKELIIGRRVGFYKVRSEIGYGTFSRVKLAFHALTKGRRRCRTTDYLLCTSLNSLHLISSLHPWSSSLQACCCSFSRSQVRNRGTEPLQEPVFLS